MSETDLCETCGIQEILFYNLVECNHIFSLWEKNQTVYGRINR